MEPIRPISPQRPAIPTVQRQRKRSITIRPGDNVERPEIDPAIRAALGSATPAPEPDDLVPPPSPLLPSIDRFEVPPPSPLLRPEDRFEVAPILPLFSSSERFDIPPPSPLLRSSNRFETMNYQNYLDQPGTPGGNNPRQAPSPTGNMNHANGVNGGGVALPGLMAGLPTPAGHQADLNHVMTMIEEFSRILAENKATTDRIVATAGRVRQRAEEQNLSNDQIIASVASELNESSHNLEVENSRLHEELEKTRYERDENMNLCVDYARAMGNMLDQLHAFKLKTVQDMSAWHRSYRDQLAAERKENLELRCRIADMGASAARGMESLRKFRREWEDTPLHHDLKVENTKLRQMCRTWKRMALRELPSDDSEFSDDSDIIDPEEKKRQKRLEEEKQLKEEHERRARSGSGSLEDATGPHGQVTIN